MNQNYITKIQRIKYLVSGLIIVILLIVYWFLTRSFFVVRISPTNAIITIDNAPLSLSRTGSARKIVTPGTHSIKIEADGYIGTANSTRFRRGGTEKIDVTLKEIPKPSVVTRDGGMVIKGNNSNEIFYLGNSGKTLYKARLNKNEDRTVTVTSDSITDPKLSGITDIIWSPNKELALFKKADGIYLYDFKKYDFVNQTESPWGKSIGDIAWAPDNSKIAYYSTPASGGKTLLFSNIMNTQTEIAANLEAMGIENPILHWSPDSRYLLLISRSLDFTQNKIYLFDSYSRSMKELTEAGDQMDAIFSPDGSKIIYSTYSKSPSSLINSMVSSMNLDGTEKKSLDLRAYIKKLDWYKDAKNLLAIGYDQINGSEILQRFDIETKQQNGFVFHPETKAPIDKVFVLDDSMIVYASENSIYALSMDDK